LKHLIYFWIFMLWILSLVGCERLPTVTPTRAEVVVIQITIQPQEQPAQSAYPSPVASATPPVSYPAPQVVYPGAYPTLGDPYLAPAGSGLPTHEPYIFKTSQPGTATLKGILAVLDPVVMMPAPDDAIYLVPLEDGEQGPSTVPPIEKGKTPQADVDERTGEFVFTNIKPGQYAVVVITLGGSEIPVRVFETNNLAIVTIQESDLDNTIDLGHLAL